MPDEMAWYWVKDVKAGSWYMAFVDPNRRQVSMWNAGDPAMEFTIRTVNQKKFTEAFGDCEWHGPINVPGGHFGSETVIPLDEDHIKAKSVGKAIGILHFDFKHCRDTDPCGRITISDLFTRAEARKLMHKFSA